MDLLNVSGLASPKACFDIRPSIELALKEESQGSTIKILGKELFNPREISVPLKKLPDFDLASVKKIRTVTVLCLFETLWSVTLYVTRTEGLCPRLPPQNVTVERMLCSVVSCSANRAR